MEPMDTASLPLPAGIVLESVHPTETVVVVQIACREHCAACPRCEQSSERVHGHNTRTVADLPCGGRRVLLRFVVRKFVCATLDCP
jgi:transposase